MHQWLISEGSLLFCHGLYDSLKSESRVTLELLLQWMLNGSSP